jgi:hypothetical protein
MCFRLPASGSLVSGAMEPQRIFLWSKLETKSIINLRMGKRQPGHRWMQLGGERFETRYISAEF